MPEAVLTEPPCFVDLDNVFSGDEMARIYKGLVDEGVVGSSDLVVSERSSGATMGVDVAPGAAWVEGDDSALLQPVYHQVVTSVVEVTVDAADGSNPRIDRVVLRIDDALFDASGQRRGRIEVITGTAASSPAAPAEPDTAITLALITVAAAASVIENADITDQRSFTAVAADRVSTASIRDGAVTEDTLGSGAVTRGKIGNGEVHEEKIAANAVTATQVAENTNGGITLAAGWSNAGGAYHTPVAQKDVTNRVYLRGVVTAPTPATSTIGTVPAGYRPWATEMFALAVDQDNAGLDSPRAEVRPDGTITVANVPDGALVSLSGITYHTNL